MQYTTRTSKASLRLFYELPYAYCNISSSLISSLFCQIVYFCLNLHVYSLKPFFCNVFMINLLIYSFIHSFYITALQHTTGIAVSSSKTSTFNFMACIVHSRKYAYQYAHCILFNRNWYKNTRLCQLVKRGGNTRPKTRTVQSAHDLSHPSAMDFVKSILHFLLQH